MKFEDKQTEKAIWKREIPFCTQESWFGIGRCEQ